MKINIAITVVVCLVLQLILGVTSNVSNEPVNRTTPLTFDKEYVPKYYDESIHYAIRQDIEVGAKYDAPYDETTIKKATQFADMYLIASEQVEAPKTLSLWSVKHYVEELNELAFKYFWYKSGRAVETFAQQQADCDMYSYLIQSAAQLQGIELNVILSPGHAFLNWDNPNGPDLTWESTSSGFVDLSNTDLYKIDYTRTAYTIADREAINDIALVQYIIDNKASFSTEQLFEISETLSEKDSPYNVLSWEKFSRKLNSFDELIGRDSKYAIKAYKEYPSDYEFNADLREYFLQSGEDKKVAILDRMLINDSEATSGERLTYLWSSQMNFTNAVSTANHAIMSAIPTLLGDRYTYKTFSSVKTSSFFMWIFAVLIMSVIFYIQSLDTTIQKLRKELKETEVKAKPSCQTDEHNLESAQTSY